MKKKYLKKITPKLFVDIYRLHGKTFYYFKRIKELNNQKDYVVLIGTPVHENIGDHLITYAEKEFLKSETSKEVIEIPIEAYKVFKKRIKKNISKDITIFIQGGGWMGTIWPQDELLIQDIISRFPENKIVIFPQTAFYEKNDNLKKIVDLGKKVYLRENLYIFLRDNISLDTMKRLYPSANLYLEPDIALFLKNNILYCEAKKSSKIGVCFRTDKENINNSLKNQILKYFNEMGIEYNKFDTLFAKNIEEQIREKIIREKLNEISQYKLVVTDRLHGMIMSYIANVPCIALDNRTHKVSAVYKTWLKNSNSLVLINTFEEFLESLRLGLTFDNNMNDDLEFKFAQLERIIKNG